MKNILYIGNKLENLNNTVTTIDTLSELLKQEGYTLTTVSNKPNKILRLLDMLFSVYKNRNNTDYVLIDTYSTLNFYYAYFVSQLCRIFKLKYIPILHGGNLASRLKRNPNLSKSIFNCAYRNVAPSAYLKTEFEKLGFYNIDFIPNTIEIENYPFINKSHETIKLLWVRRFAEIYNPKLAITVLKQLKDNGFNASLCMVGPDTDNILREVKQLAKQLNVEVKFTGKLSKEKWIQLSKEYNIFINTTNIDNTPVSVIEAMALGLPIVTTNVGGLSYLVKDKKEALLVEKNNTQEMAKAIQIIFEDKLLRETLIANAKTLVVQFDWRKVRESWQKLLE